MNSAVPRSGHLRTGTGTDGTTTGPIGPAVVPSALRPGTGPLVVYPGCGRRTGSWPRSGPVVGTAPVVVDRACSPVSGLWPWAGFWPRSGPVVVDRARGDGPGGRSWSGPAAVGRARSRGPGPRSRVGPVAVVPRAVAVDLALWPCAGPVVVGGGGRCGRLVRRRSGVEAVGPYRLEGRRHVPAAPPPLRHAEAAPGRERRVGANDPRRPPADVSRGGAVRRRGPRPAGVRRSGNRSPRRCRGCRRRA